MTQMSELQVEATQASTKIDLHSYGTGMNQGNMRYHNAKRKLGVGSTLMKEVWPVGVDT
jgi:hypothetical protein